MAGRPRTRALRGADGSVRPTAGQGREREVKAKLHARYAEAPDAATRLAVAMDYVRSAAARARRTEPARTEHLLDELVRRLLRTGDELLAVTTRPISRTGGIR